MLLHKQSSLATLTGIRYFEGGGEGGGGGVKTDVRSLVESEALDPPSDGVRRTSWRLAGGVAQRHLSASRYPLHRYVVSSRP